MNSIQSLRIFSIILLLITLLPKGILGQENEDAETSQNEPDGVLCELPCQNDGICIRGRTDENATAAMTAAAADHAAASVTERDRPVGHYCMCPTGYAGVLCEIKYVLCANEHETCFDGSTPCKRDIDHNGETFFHCQCDPLGSDLTSAYALDYCNKIATTQCSSQEEKSTNTATTTSTLVNEGEHYCANGGKCRQYSDGCSCPPEWRGVHCEIPVTAFAAAADFEQIQNDVLRQRLWLLSIILLVITSACILFLCVKQKIRQKQWQEQRRKRRLARRSKQKQQQEHTTIDEEMSEEDTPALDPEEEQDEEDVDDGDDSLEARVGL